MMKVHIARLAVLVVSFHTIHVDCFSPVRPMIGRVGPLLVASSSTDTEETQTEKEFKENCRVLCDERNLPLEKVKNARDLASPKGSVVKPGRVYRMGRLSDATERDILLLLGEREIQTIVDLRSPTELKEDETLQRKEVFEEFVNILYSERGRGKDGCLTELGALQSPIRKSSWWNPKKDLEDVIDDVMEEESEDESIVKEVIEIVTEDAGDCGAACDEEGAISADEFLATDDGAARRERHFVSIMNEFKYVRGTLSKVRKRDMFRSLLKAPGALVSRRVLASVKKPFLDEINDGGLPMVNELLLRYGAPGIKYVLELCCDRSRHPVAMHCTAGKDRTGVITALILSLCGVPDDSIVEDYSLSANVYAEMNDHSAMVGALSQRSLNPKTFLGAPPQVMRDTLQAIREDYGSVEAYLDWIGFDAAKQEKLKKAMMED